MAKIKYSIFNHRKNSDMQFTIEVSKADGSGTEEVAKVVVENDDRTGWLKSGINAKDMRTWHVIAETWPLDPNSVPQTKSSTQPTDADIVKIKVRVGSDQALEVRAYGEDGKGLKRA